MKQSINIITLIFVLLLVACNENKKKHMNEERYFESWSGINHPIKPQNEIFKDSVNFKTTYYIAVYKNESLISFKKIHNGAVLFEYLYKYDDTGNATSVTIKEQSSEDRIIMID